MDIGQVMSSKGGCVYILQSQVTKRYYIGSTNNLERRINEHNSNRSKSTKHGIPWKLVFRKRFKNLSKARVVEYQLKRRKSRKIVEKIVKDGKIKFLRG